MINVELAARASNKKTTKVLERHTPPSEQNGLKIDFNCECSDPQCKERISLTLKEYKALHGTQARFVIVQDHIEPSVEAEKATVKGISVVDKYAL